MKPEREPVLPMPSRDDFLQEKKGRGPQQVAAAMATNPNSMAANAPREAAPQQPTSNDLANVSATLDMMVKNKRIPEEKRSDLIQQWAREKGAPEIKGDNDQAYMRLQSGDLYVAPNGKVKIKK